MVLGSWDTLLFCIAGFVVLLAAARGWRRGIVRQVVSILALVLAWVAGFWGGPMLAPALGFLGLPDFVTTALASVTLGLLVYGAVNLAGTIIFKRTSQQSVGLVRWGYGIGGALLGLAYGCFTVFLIFIGIRLLGTVAEAEQTVNEREVGARRERGAVVNGLAGMKHAIDDGVMGSVFQQVDPMPPPVYRILGKMARVLGSAEAAQRFFEFPGARELSREPKIVALRDDPEIARSAQRREFLSLLRNQHIIDAANDPHLRQMIQSFELEKALDYSLEGSHRGLRRAPALSAPDPPLPE